MVFNPLLYLYFFSRVNSLKFKHNYILLFRDTFGLEARVSTHFLWPRDNEIDQVLFESGSFCNYYLCSKL